MPARRRARKNLRRLSTMVALNINGREHTVVTIPARPILSALRDTLGMAGTKYRLRRGAMRRLHRALSTARPSVPASRRSAKRPARRSPTIELEGLAANTIGHSRAAGLNRARRRAMRLLPSCPADERDGAAQVDAARQAATRTKSIKPWPAASVVAAPMPVSAPPSPTPRALSRKEPASC